MHRRALRAVTRQAVFFAMTRRARRDVATRCLRVEVRSATGLRRPADGVKALARVERVELARRARAHAGALVARDAKRFRAVTRRAVLAALRIDDVQYDVVRRMEIRRLDDALMALDALRSIVTRVARRAGLPCFLRVVVREAGTVLITEAIAPGHELTVLELGLHQATELRQVAIGAVALFIAALVAAQARAHRRQLQGRR